MGRCLTTRAYDARGRCWAGALAVIVWIGAAASGCGAQAPPVGSIDSAMVHVERQVSFGPRVPGTPARDRAARYLAHTLERYGAKVSLQSFEVDDPYSERPLHLINIVGASRPIARNEFLLCAHYDSRPWADQETDSTLWSTADPRVRSTGRRVSARLLEIARLVGLAGSARDRCRRRVVRRRGLRPHGRHRTLPAGLEALRRQPGRLSAGVRDPSRYGGREGDAACAASHSPKRTPAPGSTTSSREPPHWGSTISKPPTDRP